MEIMKVNFSSWTLFRGLMLFLSLITLIYVMGFTRKTKTFCGDVVEKKDWSREGSKGRVYQEEYLIMKWNDGTLKRVDVTSEIFFKLNIGDKTCFELIDYEAYGVKYFLYYLAIFIFFLIWWLLMGLKKYDI